MFAQRLDDEPVDARRVRRQAGDGAVVGARDLLARILARQLGLRLRETTGESTQLTQSDSVPASVVGKRAAERKRNRRRNLVALGIEFFFMFDDRNNWKKISINN